MQLGAISFDAVKQLDAGPDRATSGSARPEPLSLSAHGRGRTTAAADYAALLSAERGMTAAPPQVLLEHHLKALKLPTFLREYEKVARRMRRPRASITRDICCGWPNWS